MNNFTPKIGFELEFYLTQNNSQISDQKLIQKFIEELSFKVREEDLPILNIEKEQGLGQIEVKTLPLVNIDTQVLGLEKVKLISQELAKEFDLEIDFNPIPFLDDCSNALQINLSLLDKKEENLFIKKDDKESEIILKVIFGLINLLPNNIKHFSNSNRFNIDRNKKLFSKGKYTSPVNLSWGYDNRSCAIRVVGKDQNRRLEFRIPDANINIKTATKHFLELVNEALNSEYEAIEPIYGNAFDDQYNHIQKLIF